MAFRYSRPAMTGAAIFTLAGVTVLPLAQANAAPVSPQGEGTSSASQNAQGQQQGANADAQGQQQGANANGQQGANADAQGQQGANASDQSQNGATQGGATQDPSQAASGGEQQQGQPSASQDKQGTNASGQGQQQGANADGQGQQAQPGATQDQQQSANANAQGQQQGANANGQGQQAQGQQQSASASQGSSNSNSASQNNQSRQSQPSAPAVVAITSVDGFIDPQNTDNVLSVETTGIDNTHRVQYEPRVQELDEFGTIVNDDVSNGGGSSLGSDGSFGMYVSVDGTKINPNHQYRVYIDVFDQDTLTASYAYYPIVVWNRTYIPVVPLLAAR